MRLHFCRSPVFARLPSDLSEYARKAGIELCVCPHCINNFIKHLCNYHHFPTYHYPLSSGIPQSFSNISGDFSHLYYEFAELLYQRYNSLFSWLIDLLVIGSYRSTDSIVLRELGERYTYTMNVLMGVLGDYLGEVFRIGARNVLKQAALDANYMSYSVLKSMSNYIGDISLNMIRYKLDQIFLAFKNYLKNLNLVDIAADINCYLDDSLAYIYWSVLNEFEKVYSLSMYEQMRMCGVKMVRLKRSSSEGCNLCDTLVRYTYPVENAPIPSENTHIGCRCRLEVVE